jgi:hypothetical protein
LRAVNPSTDPINTCENDELKPSTGNAVDSLGSGISLKKNGGGGQVDTLKVAEGEEKKEQMKVEVEWEA